MAFRVQKPPIGARLDRADPLTRGLIVAAPFNEAAGSPVNSVNACISQPAGTLGWGATPKGIGRVNATAAVNGDGFAIAPYNVRGPITVEVACVVRQLPSSTVQSLFYLGSASDALYVQNYSGSNFFDLRIGGIDCNGGGVHTNIEIGEPVVFHGTYDDAHIKCYVNGALQYAQAATPSQTGSNIVSELFAFTNYGAAVIAVLDRALVWTRPLSPAEITERVADPWGIYRRAWNPKYFLKPASIAVSSTDSASIVDAASIAGSIPLADSASLIDSAGLSSIFILSDAGMLLDTQSIGANVSLADPGTLIDSLLVNAFMSSADGSSLVDSAAAGAAIALFDSASMIDLDSLAAFLSSLESASLIDSATTASTLSALDSAGFSETSLLGLFLAVADSAGLTENDIIAALTAAADSASLVDLATMIELIFAFDSAGLIDSASLNRNLPTCLVGYASIVQGAADPRFTKVTNL